MVVMRCRSNPSLEVALLVEKVVGKVGTLVTKLEQAKVDNRDLRNAHETLLAKVVEAKLQIKGLKKEN
uniref:Uncharacterized protein n=1 Tax=Cannabis sativa TaxID=3483 RepID=A0A803PR79_CANSA